MAVIAAMLFSWMASWNASLRSRMAWLAGGEQLVVIGEVPVSWSLSRAMSRLGTWLIGVMQIIHPCEGRANFWCTFSEGVSGTRSSVSLRMESGRRELMTSILDLSPDGASLKCLSIIIISDGQ